MGWMEFILAFATLVLGTGWLFTYRAYKRKADGEATQSEADGWSKVQEVYKTTIDDLNKICDEIRSDRNNLRDDRNMLRRENDDLRKKFVVMEEQILELKKGLARQDRRIETLSPLLCGVMGCQRRKILDMNDVINNGNYDADENVATRH